MGFTCAELGHRLVAKTFRKFLCSKRMHTQKYIQVILLHISRSMKKMRCEFCSGIPLPRICMDFHGWNHFFHWVPGHVVCDSES